MKITRSALRLLIENYINEASSHQGMTKKEIIAKLKGLQKVMKTRGQAYIVGPGIDTEPGDPGVVAVQSLLKKLGKDIGSSGIDGDYGPATANAISSFQSNHKELGRPDGKVGKNTIKKMITAAEQLQGGSDYEFEPAPNPYVEEEPDPQVEDEIEEEEAEKDNSKKPVVDNDSVKKELRALIANGQFDWTKADEYNTGKDRLFKKISVASKSPRFAIGIANIVSGNIGTAMNTAAAKARSAGGVSKVCQAPTADEKKFISVYLKG